MKSLSWKGSGRGPQLTIPELSKKYGISEKEIRTSIVQSEFKFPHPSVGIRSSKACIQRMQYYDPIKFLEFWNEHTKEDK